MSSSTATKSIQLTEKHVSESIETLIKWFPEESNNIKTHREAIIRHLVDGINPEIGSSLLAQSHAKLLTDATDGCKVSTTECADAIAIFIAETGMFILGLMGLRVANEERIARALIQELGGETLRGFLRVIDDFNVADGAYAKAQALFTLFSQIYKAGCFSIIFKVVKDEMGWFDWVKTSIISVAQISAWFLSDGLAFIGEVALNIMSAEQLIEGGIKAAKACAC